MTSMDGREDAGEEALLRPQLTYPFEDTPAAGETREVAPGVLWVRMPMPGPLKFINLWLIEDGDGYALVDTGMGLEETREHWRTIFSGPLKGKPITRVICTHMHPDHVGLAGWITRKFECRLWMGRLEYLMCRMLVADTGRDPPEEGLDFYRAAGWDEDALDSYRVRFGGFGRAVSRLPDGYRRLTEGEIVPIGRHAWTVVTGSGHSPEHICLWQPELGLLISGDQVLPRISSNVSVFPTEPDGDPLSEWIASCKRLKAKLPEDTLVLPAHNEPFHGLHARLDHLVAGHERGMLRIEKRVAEAPRRAVDLFGALFARSIGPEVLNMATGEAVAHVNCLMSRGRLARRMDAAGIAWYEPAK